MKDFPVPEMTQVSYTNSAYGDEETDRGGLGSMTAFDSGLLVRIPPDERQV